jgi:hypothetical protein
MYGRILESWGADVNVKFRKFGKLAQRAREAEGLKENGQNKKRAKVKMRSHASGLHFCPLSVSVET